MRSMLHYAAWRPNTSICTRSTVGITIHPSKKPWKPYTTWSNLGKCAISVLPACTWQFTKAQYLADLHGWTRFVTMQNHYNLVYREEEREMIPYCQAEGVGIIPWSPLARGFLTGSRHRGGDRETVRSHSDPFADDMYFKDSDFDIVDRVVELAKHKQ